MKDVFPKFIQRELRKKIFTIHGALQAIVGSKGVFYNGVTFQMGV
jgi:hypothetical protein